MIATRPQEHYLNLSRRGTRPTQLDIATLKHKVLATINGSFQAEARLHVMFSDEHYCDEYFTRTPRLMRWVNKNASKYSKPKKVR